MCNSINEENMHKCGCSNEEDHSCGCGSDVDGGCGCGSNHDGHSCGCSHDHDEEMASFIYLTTDNSEDIKCQVLGTFDDGVDHTYIALMPVEDEVVYLYGFEASDEGPVLRKIETDKEYDRARELFLGMVEE